MGLICSNNISNSTLLSELQGNSDSCEGDKSLLFNNWAFFFSSSILYIESSDSKIIWYQNTTIIKIATFNVEFIHKTSVEKFKCPLYNLYGLNCKSHVLYRITLKKKNIANSITDRYAVNQHSLQYFKLTPCAMTLNE